VLRFRCTRLSSNLVAAECEPYEKPTTEFEKPHGFS
jgi:hypothetical protein